MATIGFIGLGAMGGAMAQRLLDRGHDMRVWNRNPARAAELVVGGARVASTPREAADGADVVLLSVADGDALRSVTSGCDGALAGLGRDAVLVNTSTVDPDAVRELAVEAGARHVVDAGVLGNMNHARDGELRVYAGGEPEAIRRCKDVLEDLGKEVVHVGALGAGMQLKLVLNLVMGLEMQALAEAVAAGVALQLDRTQVLEAIAKSGFASPVMSFKARRMIGRRYGDPDFRLRLMAKDLALVAGGPGDRRLPMTEAARRTHEEAVAAGLGDLDCAAIVSRFERPPAPSPASERRRG
jgi:3-hydroxyisobutyrate dehydrogenase